MVNAVQFAIIGALSGVALVMTTGWFVTGYLCHRYQKLTPSTWRPEGWRHHALAMLWGGSAGAAFGVLDAQVGWSHSSVSGALIFATLGWTSMGGPVVATMATYINLHRMFVAGLLLEWWVFAVGISLACLGSTS